VPFSKISLTGRKSQMKAEIKDIHSPDIPNPSTYKPANPDNFGFLIQLFIGPKDGDGSESFDIIICTPQWLSERYNKQDIIMGRHHLIVFEYNYERIIQRINKYLQHCKGETWQQVAEKVARLGLWEFEDYVP
jgi:hypothetical protein